MANSVTAEDWVKGITLSIMASMIGGASKLAIRKSWLIELEATEDLGRESSHEVPEEEVWSDNEVQDDSIPYNQLADDSGSDESETSTSNSSDGDGGGVLTEERAVSRPWTVAHALRLSGMIGMTFLNPLCCVLAMNYASPSILAPFSGLTLVWIVLFSNPLIGERPSDVQVFAAALIVAGEVVVAIFGDHTNDGGVTLKDLRDSYLDPLFIVYFVLTTLWMFALAYTMKCGKSPILKRFAWGISGGSITGLQNFLKDSLTILKATKAWNEPHYPWYFYLMVTLAILTAFVGLLLLTACMKRYDATYSSAMFVGSFVVSASIMSAVHYNTFSNLGHVWNFILYPLGLIVLMTGVGILVHETKESTIEEVSMPPSDEPPVSKVELNEPLVQIVTKPGGNSDLAW